MLLHVTEDVGRCPRCKGSEWDIEVTEDGEERVVCLTFPIPPVIIRPATVHSWAERDAAVQPEFVRSLHQLDQRPPS